MGKPSAAFTHDELCDEFDWMYEFSSRMAERIRNDPDVHNLVAYVEKLEGQNKELQKLCADLHKLADESYVPFVRVNRWLAEIADIEYRMRNLGIEVPE